MQGTWPFKSALSLEYPLKPPEVSDDVEAFINVVVFIAIQFHHHDYSPGVEDGVDFTGSVNQMWFDMLARPIYQHIADSVASLLNEGIVRVEDTNTPFSMGMEIRWRGCVHCRGP